MKHEESKKEFLEKFKIEFPDFKVIKFTNKSSEFIVEDLKGFKYRKKTCFKIFGYSFGIDSVIDKIGYIHDKISEIHPNIKIIEFKTISEPLIIEDENGVRHIKSYYGILKYGFNVQSVINKNSYIEDKIKLKHPNLKLLKYEGIKKKLLVEDENGFKYQPQCYDIINGSKVSIETCTDKIGLFTFKANKIHNNFYNYDKVLYKNGKTKVNINCKIHGDFEQIPESHLNGRGCPKCNKVGFSKESWLKKVKNNKALFYILRVYNKDEEFIKFGITSKSVNERYKYLKNYKIEIKHIKEGSASEIYDIEKRMIKKYKCCKIFPKLPFEGWSECFDINCLNKDKLYESINAE